MRRRGAVALLAAALACFLPSWFSVHAAGHEIIRFTGTELVAGTTFQPASPAAYLGQFRGQPAAQAAAFCGLFAFLVSIPLRRVSGWAAAVSGGLAAGSLIALGFLFSNALRLQLAAGMEISRRTGYYLAIILFLAGAVCAAPAQRDLAETPDR
jgi:hypothetical protein